MENGNKDKKTKKIVIGSVVAVAILAVACTVGFKLTHKPVLDPEVSEEEVIKDDKDDKKDDVSKNNDKDKAAEDKLAKPDKKKDEVKPAVKPGDKDKDKNNSDSKPAVKPSDKDEASKPDTKPNPNPTPKPQPKPNPTPAPQPKPDPTPTPEPAPEPDPTPAPHVHSWSDVTEVRQTTETHTETVLVGSHNVCNGCGCDLDSLGEMGMGDHLVECGGSYHSEPIYENKEVTTTVNKTYVVGHKCSCGAYEACDPYPIG